MEKLCIDVRGFSGEKKKRVQDAFFKLGLKWDILGCTHQYIGAHSYGNVFSGGNALEMLMWDYGDMSEQQRKYAITYPELMRKAGMDESDPGVIISTPTKEGLEADINRVDAMASEPTVEIELVTDLQSIISDYLHLLDAIKDPYARGVIKSQLTDLTDLQYKQLSGENENA